MTGIITQTVTRAHNHPEKIAFWLVQTGAELPFGDTDAMAQAAQDEGLTVTQNDGERFLVSNTAWMTRFGVIRSL